MNSRQKILQKMQRPECSEGVTSGDLAVWLRMSMSTVNHGLRMLEAASIIKRDGERKQDGAGHPSVIWKVTPSGMNLDPKKQLIGNSSGELAD